MPSETEVEQAEMKFSTIVMPRTKEQKKAARERRRERRDRRWAALVDRIEQPLWNMSLAPLRSIGAAERHVRAVWECTHCWPDHAMFTDDCGESFGALVCPGCGVADVCVFRPLSGLETVKLERVHPDTEGLWLVSQPWRIPSVEQPLVLFTSDTLARLVPAPEGMLSLIEDSWHPFKEAVFAACPTLSDHTWCCGAAR